MSLIYRLFFYVTSHTTRPLNRQHTKHPIRFTTYNQGIKCPPPHVIQAYHPICSPQTTSHRKSSLFNRHTCQSFIITTRVRNTNLLQEHNFRRPCGSIRRILSPTRNTRLFTTTISQSITILRHHRSRLRRRTLIRSINPTSMYIRSTYSTYIRTRLLLVNPIRNFHHTLTFTRGMLPQVSHH